MSTVDGMVEIRECWGGSGDCEGLEGRKEDGNRYRG